MVIPAPNPVVFYFVVLSPPLVNRIRLTTQGKSKEFCLNLPKVTSIEKNTGPVVRIENLMLHLDRRCGRGHGPLGAVEVRGPIWDVGVRGLDGMVVRPGCMGPEVWIEWRSGKVPWTTISVRGLMSLRSGRCPRCDRGLGPVESFRVRSLGGKRSDRRHRGPRSGLGLPVPRSTGSRSG